MTMKQPLKKHFRRKLAYELQNEDEGQIAFLTLRQALKARDEWEQVKRQPEYDRYSSQGYVPIQQLLDDGWWFEYWECQRRVDGETWDYYEDEPLDLVVLEQAVFCCQSCHDRYMNERDRRQSEKLKWREFLTQNFPGIEELWLIVGEATTYAEFKIPSCQYACRWYNNKSNTIIYCQADADVVEAYLAMPTATLRNAPTS